MRKNGRNGQVKEDGNRMRKNGGEIARQRK
jgi:hypothetical protein